MAMEMETDPPVAVRELDRFPAYVYDLHGLRRHAEGIRAALPTVELFYAAKANPDARLLATLAPYVDGFEVSSGGELTHVLNTVPGARLAFGGPGKTDAELELSLCHDRLRIHVESPRELQRLAELSRRRGGADVLLRANLDVTVRGAALTMNGPFGMDGAAIGRCMELLPAMPWIRLRGVHAHLASGLDAPAMLELAGEIVRWARAHVPAAEINLGGGMAVHYAAPAERFDWVAYGAGLARLTAPEETLRIEPGRAVSAYHGWYVTDVLEIKETRGTAFAVLRGGTHHLRTPATKGHDQPFTVIARDRPGGLPGDRPLVSRSVTLVGQLCTPKDVFARDVPVDRLAPGDVVAFAMAGAYAWNISHHDFLMHPKPAFHYVDG
ncbi:MAG: Orn/DAP/Arg decarboxylase 2 [Streptosporangiaceae bacterium]|nr:Orn/DAP/Arg decarboxylase 2 [Streptosporangiaceae bacterium]